MKPTSMLKQMTIAGMLASCIFLVNCGQTKDTTKEKIVEKLALENQKPECSDETMQALKQRSDLFSSIREILAGTPDDTQKEQLQTSIDEIYTKSKLISENMRAKTFAGFPATSCVFKEKDKDSDKENEIEYQLPVIKTENLALAKQVKAVTEKQNLIIEHTRPEWKAGDRFKVSQEMASFLTNDDFINGKRIILDGRVSNGGRDFLFLKADRSVSLCLAGYLDGQTVKPEDELEIGNITARLDDNSRIVQDVTLLVPSLSGKRSLLLTCILADHSDLNDTMVDTVGSLMTKIEPSAGSAQ